MSKSGRILFAPIIWLFEFLGIHHPKLLVSIRYFLAFRKTLDLSNPKGLNEKILWALVYADKTEWTRLADKLKVREYIKEIGLGDILVDLYASWFDAKDVDFSVLPEKFIIKANNGNGKGTNKIINKSDLTDSKKKELITIIDEWLKRKKVGALSAETQYLNIRPCVIAEEVLPFDEGHTSLTDYKIWCFNGKASHICVYSNRSDDGSKAEMSIYDLDWNIHPELRRASDYAESAVMPKPANFEKMIEIAQKLSIGFPQVRVDLYNIKGKIYFGELTFSSQGGLMYNFTPEFNLELGQKVDLALYKKNE